MNTPDNYAQGVTHFADTIGRETQKMLLDKLTRDHTAFASFRDMLDAKGGYFPSLHKAPASYRHSETYRLPGGRVMTAEALYRELDLLAIAYDQAQETRGDSRRAFRS